MGNIMKRIPRGIYTAVEGFRHYLKSKVSFWETNAKYGVKHQVLVKSGQKFSNRFTMISLAHLLAKKGSMTGLVSFTRLTTI